jgi:hypothetical protein
MEVGRCFGQQPHLPGIRRPDGSLWCARCQQQLEPPDAARAQLLLRPLSRREA